MAKYGIKPEHAYMIGDSDRDVISAKKVGIKGIKVPANSNLYETLKQTELFFLLD
jgi:FMN phosphatase YigB (HAD superfamily)